MPTGDKHLQAQNRLLQGELHGSSEAACSGICPDAFYSHVQLGPEAPAHVTAIGCTQLHSIQCRPRPSTAPPFAASCGRAHGIPGRLQDSQGPCNPYEPSRSLARDNKALCAGVLDVAGGRGEVAFCLQLVHGVPATVIDPRPAKLSKAQRALLRQRAKQDSRQPVQEAVNACQQGGDAEHGVDIPGSPSGPPSSFAWASDFGVGAMSSRLQAGSADGSHACDRANTGETVGDRLHSSSGTGPPARCAAEGSRPTSESPAAVCAMPCMHVDSDARCVDRQAGCAQQHAAPPGSTQPGAAAVHGLQQPLQRGVDNTDGGLDCALPRHLQAEFGPSLWGSQDHQELLGSCSVVVGLHPDQVLHCQHISHRALFKHQLAMYLRKSLALPAC